ncbi:SCO2400 family protein [Streptomyces sp. FxanaA7]|uniref:SCO2400 family protein n=1 Tax=Streptomyces sp. FxanaA7 TaxID=1265492 RepID=UPI0005EDA71D|nr:hypothetical protein [Streptomyces sp. FxanaA7]
MDYCSSCRRHLNGALVCPGCGAYAPDIAPAAIDSRVAPSEHAGTATAPLMIPMPQTTPAAPVLPAPTWEYGATDEGWPGGAPAGGFTTDGTLGGTTSFAQASDIDGINGINGINGMDAVDDYDGVDRHAAMDDVRDMDDDAHDVDVEGVPAAPRGRAARRRQMARWKKNQRRAVVATAVALVGGGLTVMGMDRQSTDRTQAATAPDAESLGSVEQQGSQRDRTSATETDDARRTPDDSPSWTPSGDPARDRSAANRSNSRAEQPNSPRTDSATPSVQEARTGSSGAGRSADDSAATPSDGTTTPPATDDPGASSDAGTGTGAGSGADNGSDTGSEAGSGSGGDTGSGSGSDTGASDGSSSDTATTSPSGLCLLGIVCVN